MPKIHLEMLGGLMVRIWDLSTYMKNPCTTFSPMEEDVIHWKGQCQGAKQRENDKKGQRKQINNMEKLVDFPKHIISPFRV